jgi:hypothetical protein
LDWQVQGRLTYVDHKQPSRISRSSPATHVPSFLHHLISVLQARLMRPLRERTCDDVNRSLARQEAVLINLMQKLQRGSALVAVDIGKLQDVYQKLATSLKDKVR